MKKLFVLATAIALLGCNTIAAQLPSVQNCQHVTYTRDYSVAKVYLECDTSKSGTIE